MPRYEDVQAYIWWTENDEEPTLLGRGIASYELRRSYLGGRLEDTFDMTVNLLDDDPLVGQLCDAARDGQWIPRIRLMSLYPIGSDELREVGNLRVREMPQLHVGEDETGVVRRYLNCRFSVGKP